MIDLSLQEAQLFRMLGSFFGADRLVVRMSVLAVCGGEPPAGFERAGEQYSIWARDNTCLFTVVDLNDEPRVVVEFFSPDAPVIDLRELEHQRLLAPILAARGIKYLTLSNNEFAEMLDPQSTLDFFHWLKDKFEADDDDDAS